MYKEKSFSIILFVLSITLGSIAITVAANYLMLPYDHFRDTLIPGVSIAVVISLPVSYFVGRMIVKIKRLNVMLLHAASHDFLTNLPNRKRFFDYFDGEEDGVEGVVLIIDVDRFKQVNDEYGHDAGDEVLKGISKILSSSLRDTDMLARFGGEEFVVFLPGSNRRDADTVAERLRINIQNSTIKSKLIQLCVTVSVGGAVKLSKHNLNQTLINADKALYKAKNSGRNRVVFNSPDGSSDENAAPPRRIKSIRKAAVTR